MFHPNNVLVMAVFTVCLAIGSPLQASTKASDCKSLTGVDVEIYSPGGEWHRFDKSIPFICVINVDPQNSLLGKSILVGANSPPVMGQVGPQNIYQQSANSKLNSDSILLEIATDAKFRSYDRLGYDGFMASMSEPLHPGKNIIFAEVNTENLMPCTAQFVATLSREGVVQKVSSSIHMYVDDKDGPAIRIASQKLSSTNLSVPMPQRTHSVAR